MRVTESPFVIKKYDSFGGSFVDSQYLGAAYNIAPHIFENILMKMYSSQTRFFTGKPLLGMTGGKTFGTMEIPIETYRYRMQGAEKKHARVVENLESSNSTPGLQLQPFRVKLDLDYYHRPDVLFPEDNNFPVEILDGPIQDGSGYIYTLRLQGDDPLQFLPAALLDPGKEFNKVWTTVADEFNDEFGTQQYPAGFVLEKQVGAFAQKFEVTDKAWRQQGRLLTEFLYTDPKTGKAARTKDFLPMAESEMYNELYQSMEAQLWYGKQQTRPAHTGYWKKTGAGVREQLKEGWTDVYNGVLTVEKIKNYLMDIFFSREDEQNRKVVAMTGTLGSWMFHDMLAAEAASFFTVDTHFIQQLSKNPRHLSYGAQFTHYQGPEGIEVTLVKNPMYDSREYSKRSHPLYPGKPIDSMRMTFMDFGSSGNDNNVTLLKVKDTFSWGYRAGTFTPNGPVKGGEAGALKAGYDMFCTGTAGVCIKDVTRCGELIYDFEA